MPSIDILFKWSTGIRDGHPDPELWADAIYAAFATWPDETQFLLIRYSDPVHDPNTCWALAQQAAALYTMIERLADPDPAGVEATAHFQHWGSQRYPRFASALQGPFALEAVTAAWFSIFRQADRTVYAASVRHLLDRDDPLSDHSVEAQSVVWIWLVDAVWILNGHPPIQSAAAEAGTDAEDPLWEDLKTLWPRLPLPTRQALVTLAQQSPV